MRQRKMAKESVAFNACNCDQPEVKTTNDQATKQDTSPFNPSDTQQLIDANRKKFFSTIMKVFVVFLGLVIIASVVTSTVIMTFASYNDKLGSMSLDIKRGKITLKNAGKDEALKGLIGKGFVGGKLYKRRATDDVLYYEWLNTVNLLIQKDQDYDKCFKLEWSPGESDLRSFQDCYSTVNQQFYGGSELFNQSWPLNKASISMKAFLPMDTILGQGRNQTVFGPVLERYWITSHGIAIIVDDSTPLHVGFNENQTSQICLKSDLQGYPGGQLKLAYRLCIGENVKTVHQNVMKRFFKLPTSTPSERMLTYPIWSTWAIYGAAVTQNEVMDFAQNIQNYNMTCSQIEIDDKYTLTYGDYDFDVKKFPNATAMISSLHNKGYKVTTWVHPFANTDSKAFLEYVDDWVKGVDPLVPGLVRWWNGIGGILDTTNNRAVQSFMSRLKSFQTKYNIDGFKFDAGSVSYLPKGYKLNNASINNPSWFSSNYATLASQFGGLVEARVGYRTQNLPMFIRILDRQSIWGALNGLKSVIPAVLTLGILGYPFVLPDMVGGNGYEILTSVNLTQKPEKELYIRWVQMNIFLPAIQFSFAPWLYDNETVEIVKKFISLREKMSSVLIKTAKDVSVKNAPIIRPLWWFAPQDSISLSIDSQFLLGDDFLVAPVLDPFTVHKGFHKVYFPPGGKWKRQFGSTSGIIDTNTEGKWITFKVNLEDLPYFSLIKDI